jgi:hypothetical protein
VWCEYENTKLLGEFEFIKFGDEETTVFLYDTSREIYIKIDNESVNWGENLNSVENFWSSGKWDVAPGKKKQQHALIITISNNMVRILIYLFLS